MKDGAMNTTKRYSSECKQGAVRLVSAGGHESPPYTGLRILEVEEIKTVPHVPLSHPFVERLIGTTRREFIDLVPFWSAHDLDRKLHEFQNYYNGARVHRALDGTPPNAGSAAKSKQSACLDHYRWESHCLGLYQLPAAA